MSDDFSLQSFLVIDVLYTCLMFWLLTSNSTWPVTTRHDTHEMSCMSWR